MSSLRSFHLVAVVCLGVVAAPLLRSSEEADVSPRFEQLDHDGDGYLTLQELADARLDFHPFPLADHDRDGLLSLLEFRAALDAAPARR